MCAAPALARPPESSGSRWWTVWIGLAATLAIQLCVIAYGYGALNTRVDALKESMQELKADVKAVRDTQLSEKPAVPPRRRGEP